MDPEGGHGRLVFPDRGTAAFSKITASNSNLEKFLRIMRDRPASTIAERAILYRQVVLNQVHEDLELVIEDDPGKDAGQGWLQMDMEISQENWAANDAPLIANRSCNESQGHAAPSEGCESDPEEFLMSIEDIGEELQTKVLELKGALHKEEPHVDVGFLLEVQGDVLACVAKDLSTLPTSQICLLLKSFLAVKSNRMLQCDLALLFRHLVLAHLKQPFATAGAKILSYGADLASRWSLLFVENVLIASLTDLNGTLETFLKKSLKAIESRDSEQALTLLWKTLAAKSGILTTENVDQVLNLAEVLVANSRDFGAEVFTELRIFYRTHDRILHKNRMFAKNLLDMVKRTKDLEPHKPIVNEILTTMTHPMKNIIQKLIVPKPSISN